MARSYVRQNVVNRLELQPRSGERSYDSLQPRTGERSYDSLQPRSGERSYDSLFFKFDVTRRVIFV